MFKATVRYLLLALLLTIFVCLRASAQATITIGAVDPGPYAPGSTIAVPFHINDATGCMSKTNVFTVEMSDAAGSFASPTVVGTSPANTFYATFVNVTVPNGTPAGTGYKFRVKASSPGVTTTSGSNDVTINTTAGPNAVVAAASFPTITTEVFGQCNGPAAGPYTIYDNGSGATTLKASFFNEATQTFEATDQDISSAGYQFTANQVTYTVFVKSTNAAGKISTKAYQLINNQINSNIGQSGNGTVCIAPGPGGNAPLTYNIGITGTNGIQNNYPGNLYTFSWGDGTPNTVLTLCEIIALGGQVTHPYTRPSCGNASGQNNHFQVDINISNTYCGNVGTRTTSYALILKTPTNVIQGPAVPNICTGTTVTFGNGSDPGVDPNSNSLNCNPNPNARFTWYVDGVLKTSPGGVTITNGFTYTFSTHGTHTVTLRALNTNSGACTAADATYTVCVQDPPTPNFSLPAGLVCMSTTVIPTDLSVVDAICNSNNVYTWSASPATYQFVGGTDSHSITPQFKFNAAGTYTITLSIATPGNCTSNPKTLTLVVAAPPTAVFGPDLSLCSNGQTITFDNSLVTFTGASAAEGSTFSWVVNGAGTSHFVNSTTSNSQYPQILFDNFGTYQVTVTRTNICGTVSATLNINFQQAPTVSAGPTPPILCQAPSAGTPTVVTLNGSITGTYISAAWSANTNGTPGIFSAGTSPVTDYTPSTADYAKGSVTLTLTVNTGLAGSCSTVTSSVTLTLTKRTLITSASSKTICSGDNVGYTINANNAGSTFTWTGTVISGSASGVTASGTGGTINDQLVNLTPTTDAVIKYTITPTSANGCPGDPFDFTVTLLSVPVVTGAPSSPAICSNSPAGISFSSSTPPSRYTWTVSAPAGITGANNQPAFTNSTTINDVLVNHTSATITVKYTITPYNLNSVCPGLPVDISVDVYPLPVASVAGKDTILCGVTTYALQGNAPTPGTGKWTIVSANGPTITFADDTSPTTTISGLTDGSSYTLKWTITSPNGCISESSVNISVTAATVGGTTGGAATVCAGSNNGQITLSGKTGNIIRWEKSIDNGTSWQTVPGNNTSINYTYNNLTQTTQYRALVQNGTCTQQYSSITIITVNPAAPVAQTGPTQTLCAATSTALTGNDPGTFAGVWRQISGPAAAITDSTNYQTTVTGLVGDQTYVFSWTIAGLAPCPATSAQLTVVVSAATIPGTTSGADTVCAANNSGNITLSGKHGNILRWESSTDNGLTWQTVPAGNTSDTQAYLNLTQTTQYRAVVQNGSCNIETSTATTITVNPPSVIANAGVNQILCNLTTATLNGNDPGIFVGTWTQTSGPAVTITNIHNRQTTVTGLTGANTYTFRWTISGLPPCPDSFADVTITNNADVVASFTPSPKSGCGNLSVKFTNTSNNQAGAVFQWNFGDGSTSNAASPQHVFAQRTDGRDTTYYISLKVIGNCIDRPAIIDSVLVRPATPIARILPASTNGCGNFAIDVRNTSPGNNISYDFYLYNGNTLVQKITKTDKTDVIFDPITTTARTVFTLYMVSTGYCGTTNETTHIPIAISPANVIAQMFLQNDLHASCAPLNTTFVNNSFGGTNFYYTVYDANNNIVDKPTASTTTLPYTFTKPGTYYVTITAINSCGLNESPRTRIDVYATPKPAFAADVTTGCKDVRVTFTNSTVADDGVTPATSLVYDWDFGDGSAHSNVFQPTHAYHFTNTPYTVTLTATNTTSGCTASVTKTSYIVLTGPPLPAFTVNPDTVISIPNYTFSFVDRSTRGAATWRWTFSDGQVSTQQNPTVTFPDTGLYKVTLTSATAIGCDTSITKTVRITGVPGQLFLPNAFMPNSATSDLRMFRAKGSGIKQWHLQIFDIYGQLLWETTKLTARGEPVEGWDGTFKGTPMPQGVYQWQASATFINGNEWKGNAYGTELPKRVGSIHLIK